MAGAQPSPRANSIPFFNKELHFISLGFSWIEEKKTVEQEKKDKLIDETKRD